MPELPREDIILRFLAVHDIPLRHKEIYGGIIHHNAVTFSYKQTRDTVTDLHDRGLVRRVEIDDGDGVIRDIPADASGRRGYYLISEAGRDAAPVQSESS